LGVVATTAEAVVRNPDNTGQVLIYPYYTVQTAGGNAFNTYVSVTNTTTRAKVLKVRFREGKTSAEVLDFNLYLSPNDMWVGVLEAIGTGTGDAARLKWAGDLSCTDPPIPTAGEPFKNFAYLASPDSLPGTTLDRTREGYIEMFEMANLTGSAAANVTHPQTVGARPACPNSVMSYITNTVPSDLTITNREAPSGGLYGNVTLINVGNGADFGYVADALDQYAASEYYQTVNSQGPLLGGTQVNNTGSALASSLTLINGTAFSEDFAAAGVVGATSVSAGARAVASVFMHSAVLNDYVIHPDVGANTDWVVTFPIKREFVTAGTAFAPFTGLMTTNGACEPALFNVFDRDEQSLPPGQGGFSPTQGTAAPGVGNLCWESTVISIRNNSANTANSADTASLVVSNVLGSRNSLQSSPGTSAAIAAPQNFNAGWMRMSFTGVNTGCTSWSNNTCTGVNSAGGLTSAGGNSITQAAGSFTTATQTFVGLPVTGFMVRQLVNNAVTCVRGGVSVTGGCQGNYGSLFEHAYRSTVR
jgi:hypothetical protein